MATYNELATAYATNKRKDYENSLAYLTNDVNTANTAAINAINSQYDAAAKQLKAQEGDVTSAYEKNANQAYLNKLMAGREIGSSLSELGLANSGAGLQAQLNNATAYGQNLASLQDTRDTGLRDIANQINASEDARRAALLNQNTTYQNELANANIKKQSLLDAYYAQEYNNYLNDLMYQDKLRQQEFENSLSMASTYGGGGGYYGGGGSSSGYTGGVVAYGTLADSYGDGKGNVIYTDVNGTQYKMKQGYNPYTGTKNSDVSKGTFANGYQPNNVGGKALSKVNGAVINVNGQNQSVWRAENNYYYWDGTKNKYYKLSASEKQSLGLQGSTGGGFR